MGDDPRMASPSDAALRLASEAYEMAKDPALAFIVAMAAAAITGHVIERSREQMHEALDRVFDAAQAKLLEVTETMQ